MRSVTSIVVMIFVLTGFALAQEMTGVGPKVAKRVKEEQKAIKVKPLKLPEGYNTGEVAGNIKDGVKLTSLRWAERSSVACFPGTRFEMFTGNHVFYRIILPAASAMKLVVTPADGKTINLYALRQGIRDQATPPNITSAISCEASYPIYANVSKTRRVTNKDDGTRKVEYISVNSPYSILIGVAGAEGLTEGDFKLKIEIKPR